MSDEKSAFDEGFELGQAWAKHAEGLGPHNALLEMRDDLSDFEWAALFDEDISPNTYWEWLAGCLIGDEDDKEKLRSFWKWAIGESNLPKLDQPEFVKGFADGARADWSSFYTKGVS